MDDDMKRDLVINDASLPTTDHPPVYSPGAPPQYPQQYGLQQPVSQYPPSTVISNVPQQPAESPAEAFGREACFAHCVRIWWCRPIGWLAVAELDKARALYLAGDYDGAEQAAKKANMWSTVGLVTGLLVVAGVAVATHFIIRSFI